jgi:site-specific recombinase XerD
MRTKAPSSPYKRVSLDQLRLSAGEALWISRDGSPCTEQTFANIIRKRTREAGRAALSPHLYRSRAARSIAVDASGDVEIIPAVLGHGSPKTAERQYNLAGSREASRDHGRLIDDLRQRLSRRPRRRSASFRR